MDRRVLEDQRSGPNLHVRLDDLEDRAPAGDESLVVDDRVVDVLEPADRVEVVLLVVVEGLLFAQPTKHRVRIGVQFDVVWVEVGSLHGRAIDTDRHGVASRSTRGA
jgi:hypothetical protein